MKETPGPERIMECVDALEGIECPEAFVVFAKVLAGATIGKFPFQRRMRVVEMMAAASAGTIVRRPK